MKTGRPGATFDPLEVFWLMCAYGRQEPVAELLDVSTKTLQRHAARNVALQFALDGGYHEYRRRTYPHGRVGGYTQGCRCAPCTDANTRYRRADVADRRTRLSEAPHGTDGAYSNWGCRCTECTAAHSKVMRAQHERRRAAADGG